jgi:hypothetical protein
MENEPMLEKTHGESEYFRPKVLQSQEVELSSNWEVRLGPMHREKKFRVEALIFEGVTSDLLLVVAKLKWLFEVFG